MVEPRQLLYEMSDGIGLQFQDEWALYSCSMLTTALANIAELYPETKPEAVKKIDSLIQIVRSPKLRLYDKMCWEEALLESLDGNNLPHVGFDTVVVLLNYLFHAVFTILVGEIRDQRNRLVYSRFSYNFYIIHHDLRMKNLLLNAFVEVVRH